MSYIPGIPLPTDLLSKSQGDIRTNFTVANIVMDVDHYPFDDATANKGRHKDVHIVKRVGNPTNVSGVEIVFGKDYTPNTTGGTADTQLFAMTGNGGLSQLTGNLGSGDGWVWSGGLLFQWGVVTQSFSSGGTSGTVTFKDRVVGAIPFPTQCFVVQTTPFCTASNPGSQANAIVRQNTLTNLKFDWRFFTNSSDYKGFYWFAIGN